MIVDKNQILTKKNNEKHEIKVDPNNPDAIMEVWIRETTFLDIQRAAQEMFDMSNGEVSLNLESYWKYAFTNWIVETNPSLTSQEMSQLTIYVGEQISAILPKPEELAEAMQGGFTKASNE